MDDLTGVGLVLIVAATAAIGGVAFGIFLLAPRLGRVLDRAETDDEEPW